MSPYDLKARLPDDDLVPLRDCLREAKRLAERRAPCTSFCVDCGHSHAKERRLPLLRRLLADGVERETIHAEYPCLWPADAGGERMLYRDIAELRRSAP